MKRFSQTTFLSIAGLILVWAVLVGSTRAATQPIVVYVSVPPQVSLVREIGGPNVEVHSLVSAGQDPHLFSPTPREIRALGRAQVFFTVGMPFEKPVLKKISGHLPNMRIVDSVEGFKRRTGCLCGHDHHKKPPTVNHKADHQPVVDGDPHVWLSPLGLRTMAKNVAKTLISIDPTKGKEIHGRSAKLIKTIDAVDARVKAKLAPYRGRAVYVYHPSLGYFCDAYGLRQKAIEVEGRLPNTKQLRQLIAEAKKDRVQTIYVQPKSDRRGAEVVARAVGAKLVRIDTLADDAVVNLERIAKTIASGMAPQKAK